MDFSVRIRAFHDSCRPMRSQSMASLPANLPENIVNARRRRGGVYSMAWSAHGLVILVRQWRWRCGVCVPRRRYKDITRRGHHNHDGGCDPVNTQASKFSAAPSGCRGRWRRRRNTPEPMPRMPNQAAGAAAHYRGFTTLPSHTVTGGSPGSAAPREPSRPSTSSPWKSSRRPAIRRPPQ